MQGPLLTRCKRLLALMFALCLSAPAIAAANPNPFVGTVSDETFESLGYLYQPGSIDDIAAAGVGSLRQTFDWQYLRKGDTLNWDMLDHYVGGAAQHGITIIPVLFDPPRDPAAIGAYGAQLAARYGTNGSYWAQHPTVERHPITTWQIWNEPNLPVYRRPRLSPKGYAKMLCAAYQQIKAVDPNSEISTAGLPKSRIRSSMWPSKYVPRMMR